VKSKIKDRVEAMACALFEKEHAAFRGRNPIWAKGDKAKGIAGCRAKSWQYLSDEQKAAFVQRVSP
jgi:hypothetical protein